MATRYVIYEEGKGYIRSIPKTTLGYTLTKKPEQAKKFNSLELVEGTIDELVLAGYSKDNQLHVFGYEEYISPQEHYYNDRALRWAERYGILNYKVNKNLMIYYVSYPAYLRNPRYTIKHTVNLDTMRETTEPCKRFVSEGLANRH